MKKYYVSIITQLNGDHEVHHEGCIAIPATHNRLYLGEFASCSGAVTAARKEYVKSDGCKICSNLCHSRA